jgi:glycosyltransferase involved in cell wall biosynthesis
LNNLSNELNISSSVEWIGHIPQNELFSLYQSVDCLLFPSLHDSSGNVVLEAMSFGLPVVCLDLGGPAVIADKTCGIIVNTANKGEEGVAEELHKALVMLIDYPELRAELSQGARQKCAGMTWSAQVKNTMKLIEERFCLG